MDIPVFPGALCQKYAVTAALDDEVFADDYLALLDGHANLADALALAPQDMAACYREGAEAYQAGEYSTAARAFFLLTFLRPDDGQLHLALGSALQQLGESASALMHFSSAADLSPQDPGALFRVAECQASLEEREGAREALRRCLDLCATHATAPGLYQRASALMDQLH
ncbi:MAG: hypothetical protein JO171_02320 [Paludibacterium sp.]|uniref:hypothetical protein n=1 Tax=Paludibacterium sp. TaxID=1917523 RepID=UPI0025FEB104|nr:hypothetical protein [Paludibacterium sp.]MBV8045960.1 hypothetical protein [Paludibacterium sp.]MBV8648193.1 hypothetical protein [Paludibacterium sp.]